MKSLFLSFILFAFLLHLCVGISSYNLKTTRTRYTAAFFTANLEGGSLKEKHIIKALKEADPNINDLNSYDVLFISLQEASTTMNNFHLTINNFDCRTQYKVGKTKLLKSSFSLVSLVCFKSNKFSVHLAKSPDGYGTRLKGGVGNCLAATNTNTADENVIFCFIAVHLDVDPVAGAARLKKLTGKIHKRLNSNFKLNVFALGDWNLRVYPKYNGGDAAKTEQDLKTAIANEYDKFKEGNNEIERIFKDSFLVAPTVVKNLAADAFHADFPKSNLLTLQFTYKYLGGKSGDYDYKNMAETKLVGAGKSFAKPLNNLGWLDRLGCVIDKDTKKCRIKELQYSEKSKYKRGDHMPIVGSFVFYQ